MNRLNENNAFFEKLDFLFCVRGEKKEGKGEDSFLTEVSDRAALVGAFDGCGGSGAKIYPEYGGMTGAYIASRAVAEMTFRWFEDWTKGTGEKADCARLKKQIDGELKQYNDGAHSASMLRSSLTRAFPSTLALEVLSPGSTSETIRVQALWSGDSRCYLLDPAGMRQISVDDLPVTDALQNLQEDAAMLNVISASHKYEIHEKVLEVSLPCILFSATDGCFGYLKSPMEMEKLLLGTLLNAGNIAEWKETLWDYWHAKAGDDFTFSAAGAGFGSFENLKQLMRPRQLEMERRYPLKSVSDTDLLKAQWEEYRVQYEQYQTRES